MNKLKMVNFSKLFLRCERNIVKNLLDYYNQYCVGLVKKERRYKMETGDNWCAMFTSVIAHMSGIKNFPYEVSVMEQFKIAKERNTFTTDLNEIQCGDLIVYNWDCNWNLDHVGIVESVRNGFVHAIEGNHKGGVNTRVVDVDSPCIGGFIKL